MATITHHRFRYFLIDEGQDENGELKAKLKKITDWILLFLVAGMTVFLVISFSIL